MPPVTGDPGGGNQVKLRSNIANVGPLNSVADSNGLHLPAGFSSRVVARTGERPASNSTYPWHEYPDGGATFATDAGGWIYVSNSEVDDSEGGVGALEFDSGGNLVDAFPLLYGTSANCAGGVTPRNTWLSCEEFTAGMVWECFPLERGSKQSVRLDALGVFKHEAAAVDPATGVVYLTEDQLDGCLYRFIPDVKSDLSKGRLQAAVVDSMNSDGEALEGSVSWVDVPDASAATVSVRRQARERGAARFLRGEGAWFHNGVLFFTTTADNVVWAYEPATNGATGMLTQIYSRSLFADDDTLNGVDNITVSAQGDVLVAEDSDDMQIQALTPDGLLVPLLKLDGHTAGGRLGEITGPAFDPSGTRLYFSSQRGAGTDYQEQGRYIGVTFEVTGPFVIAVDSSG